MALWTALCAAADTGSLFKVVSGVPLWSLSLRTVRTVQGCGLGEQWDRADVILTSMIIHDIQGVVSSGSASPCQQSPGGVERDFGAEDQRPTGDPLKSSI